MARDHSEYIDDYCYATYGHSNWGYVEHIFKRRIKKS